jgi:hypothetical protein
VKGQFDAANLQIQFDAINNDLLILERKIVGLDTEIDGMQSTLQASINDKPELAYVKTADVIL